jgi:hypothetical protein
MLSMNTAANHRAALIRWELGWITLEASVSAIAVWLMLGAGLADLGSGILFLLVAISLFVRWNHYVGERKQSSADEARSGGALHRF